MKENIYICSCYIKKVNSVIKLAGYEEMEYEFKISSSVCLMFNALAPNLLYQIPKIYANTCVNDLDY